jgi:type I restriction enzyme, S subunit
MSFPKYEVYKDSGVEWLGEVPEHWETMPFFSRFRARKGQNTGLQENNLLSLSYGRIVEKDINTLDGLLPESFETYQIVSPCDIVFRLTDLQNDKRSLRSAIVQRKGIITSAYLAVESLNIDSCFANYLFRAYDLLKVFYSMGGGLRQSMKYSDMKWLPILTPPSSEQRQIADFLDRETTRIDALIAEQQRLIELLKEKRQAVISHAVTKGIDRTVPMKDSGVEWLGEVPEHWKICQSKHLFDSVTSGSRGWAEYYSDDGHLFFRIANLTRDTIDPKLDSKQFVNPPVGSEGERSKIRVCDILISITADLGSVCVANLDIADGYVSQHVALVRPTEKKVFSRWLAYFVLSSICKEQLLGAGYGGTKIQLSLEDIKSFLVATPPYEEQILIASFLDSEISKFESLINEAVLGIALLTERRSALISAAVTGKIDVRNWQPPSSN